MQFLTPLVIKFMPDGLRRLTRPLIAVSSGDPCLSVVVPCGFCTDLASVPKPFRNLIDNDEHWLVRPAVLHDWLYSEGRLPRRMCDAILRRACLAEGAPTLAAWLVWAAVRLFGRRHYRESPAA